MSEQKKHKQASDIKYDELRLGEYTRFLTELPDNFFHKDKYTPPNEKEVKSQIPGTIYQIFVKEGQTIKAGEKLLILEAMKMRNQVTSPITGVIKTIKVKKGDIVRKNTLLLIYE